MAQSGRPSTATLYPWVDLLYSVCDDLSRWPVFLRRLARATGAGLVLIHEVDPQARCDVGLVGYPPDGDSQERYNSHFGQAPDNPWLADGALGWFQVGRVFAGSEVLPLAQLEQTSFYREFLEPAGLGESLTVVFDSHGPRCRALSLSRSREAGPFDAGVRALLAGLGPHLRRALRLSDLLTGAQRLHRALQDTVERVPVGMLLFDGDGHLVLANGRARRLLGDGLGLWLDQNGQPRSDSDEVTAQLRRLLERASAQSAAVPPSASQLLLPRASGQRPLSALVAPVANPAPGGGSTFAALFLSDPDDRLTPRSEVLQERCGLTPTEARVAAMMVQGQSVDQVAAALDSSLHTIRTHLKRIYAKTDTHRQASLVSLLVNVVGALDAERH